MVESDDHTDPSHFVPKTLALADASAKKKSDPKMETETAEIDLWFAGEIAEMVGESREYKNADDDR
jgi:hypothetical protein